MATGPLDNVVFEPQPMVDTARASFASRLLDSDTSIRLLEIFALVAFVSVGVVSWLVFAEAGNAAKPIAPEITAFMLVANLLPATLLLVLIGRRFAIKRAARSDIGSKGRLHVRLVLLFSLIAAIPTMLVVIFASLLFQNGVQFWFSDPARSMLENAGSLAQGYYEEKVRDVSEETVTMAGDLRSNLQQSAINDPRFYNAYALQVIRRKLSDSAIIEIGADGVQRTPAAINPSARTDNWISVDMLNQLEGGKPVAVNLLPEKIEVVTPLIPESGVYLYASRKVTSSSYQLGSRAQAVLKDYSALVDDSRALQLQFNAALYLVSLAIIAIAVWVALIVADRLVRPISQLVHAASDVADGNLARRVPVDLSGADEIGILAYSFNRMTERLEDQTSAIISANSQLDNRRQFIEAVLESVAAGIISVDQNGDIVLANSSAQKLLGSPNAELIGKPLRQIAPPFADLVEDGQLQSVIQIEQGPDARTFAVRVEPRPDGAVLSFEDISQQLVDQRRAAWSDVARRIAHEIKNPLTPINLAAERLRRRYSKQIAVDELPVFEQLTETIIRQVSDLRKIVDEFSSFARMPKPLMREENFADIVRQGVFLMEVAHPAIAFTMQQDNSDTPLLCDRRQMGQMVTNILKNAVEAIEEREAKESSFTENLGQIAIQVGNEGGQVAFHVQDNGVGLPQDRESLLKPYITHRAKGTGLGLAIVKKIVEEHFGEISFADAPSGGAQVSIVFRPVKSAPSPTATSQDGTFTPHSI